jgi:HD-like signal output (HDOD) protein
MTMDRTQTLSKLDLIENLPTLPVIVQQIQKLIESPKSNMSQIAIIISRDQSIAARVVRLVNSAFYGMGTKISSIQQAIMLLGLNTVKNLVIGVSVVKLFESTQGASIFDRQKFWLHTFGCATGARLIAKRLNQDEPEDFFMAGLLHGIGILVLDQFFHDEFNAILQQTVKIKCDVFLAETGVLGLTHCEIGEVMAKKWRLPEYLTMSIRHHHKPNFSELENEYYRLIAAVAHVADTTACEKGITPGFLCAYAHFEPAYQLVGLKSSVIEEIFDQVEIEVKQVMSDWGIR